MQRSVCVLSKRDDADVLCKTKKKQHLGKATADTMDCTHTLNMVLVSFDSVNASFIHKLNCFVSNE